MTHRVHDVLVFAIAFAALVVALAVRGVEASARPVVAAVPVSWLFCDEPSDIASDAADTRGGGQSSGDECAILSSAVVASWQDGGEDDDEE
jgi:hypothetical protein